MVALLKVFYLLEVVTMLNSIINKFGSNYKIKGNNIWFKCKFHNGNSFNCFSVDKNTGLYYCFKCGAKGKVNGTHTDSNKVVKQSKEKDKAQFINKLPNQQGINYMVNYLATRHLDSNITSKLLQLFNMRIVGEDFTEYGYKWDYKKVGKVATYKIQQGYIIGVNVGSYARYEYKVDTNFNKVYKGWGYLSDGKPLELKKSDAVIKNSFIFEGFEDLIAFIILELNNIDFNTSNFICLFGIHNINKIDVTNPDINYYFGFDEDEAGFDKASKYIASNIYWVEKSIGEYKINGVKDFNELHNHYKANYEYFNLGFGELKTEANIIENNNILMQLDEETIALFNNNVLISQINTLQTTTANN
jgi:hypothetical protein